MMDDEKMQAEVERRVRELQAQELQKRAERQAETTTRIGIAVLAFLAGVAAFGIALWGWWSSNCVQVLGVWTCR